MPRRDVPEPLAQAVGQRIRHFRELRGLTLEKLAYETDQSKGHLSDVERGFSRPSLATLNRIAEHLDVLLLDLVTFPEVDARQAATDALRELPKAKLRRIARRASK